MRSLLALSLLSGCVWITNKEFEERQDLDGDGAIAQQWGGEDCDDGDTAIHPDASERCDGIDEDCDGQVDEDPVDGQPFYTDADGDGHGSDAEVVMACELPAGAAAEAGDCDDDDDAISPDAEERCDDVDQDCDGEVDEGSVDAPTWYLDADADGYGLTETTVSACDPPDGYVARDGDCDDDNTDIYPGADEPCGETDWNCDGSPGDADSDGDGFAGCVGDCDDTEPGVHPDATEACNGVDDDCDGGADDEDPEGAVDEARYYPDEDGDGAGDETSSGGLYCDPPDGWVSTAEDCDDADAEIHPDHYDVCDDADTDSDCDGLTTDCSASLADSPLALEGEADGDALGAALAGAVDLDGDGLDDVGLGAPGGADGLGAAYILLKPEGSTTLSDAAAWTGASVNGEAGAALAGLGDVDGDGLDDLGVGAPGGSGAFVLHGPASAGGSLSGADALLGGEAGSGFGTTLAGGDLDGDGVGDLVAGAPETDGAEDGAGAVYLFLGELDATLSAEDAAASWAGEDEGEGFGRALAVGDLDGDAAKEIVVGSRPTVEDWVVFPKNVGQVSAYDPASGASARFTIQGSTEGLFLGDAVSAGGDASGDGNGDLLAGDPENQAVYLFQGSLSGSMDETAAAATFTDDSAGSGFGTALSLGQDLNGDGVSDVVIGAPDAGTVYLWLGGVSLSGAISPSDADFSWSGTGAGGALAPGGDVDGDGEDDLWIGAPDRSSETGTAWLILGAGF